MRHNEHAHARCSNADNVHYKNSEKRAAMILLVQLIKVDQRVPLQHLSTYESDEVKWPLDEGLPPWEIQAHLIRKPDIRLLAIYPSGVKENTHV